MPTETSALYDRYYEHLIEGRIAMATDTWRMMLTTASYVPNKAEDLWRTTPAAFEVVGTGYTIRGAALTNKVKTTTSTVCTVDADDVSWPGSTITARLNQIYKDTGTDGTSPLIRFGRLAADLSSVGAAFTYTASASGLFTHTTAVEA